MPLTKKGKKIMSSMKSQYGEDKGESVFYASRNKGTIEGVDKQKYHNFDGTHGKHTGDAENMGMFGPDESSVLRQNAPFRDLQHGGHQLNHSYKNPVPAVSPDVKAAGTNHSYLHPHSHSGMSDRAHGFPTPKVNRIRPMGVPGTGKS